MKKLNVWSVLKSGTVIGMKNALSVIGATVLYILTIWIPYINVGTTIAMAAIPVELSKGKVISPLFIFKSEYRRRMGEFFILEALTLVAMLIGLLFGVIPMYVIAIAWSLSLYLFIDKDMTALEAMRESNRLTYGNKWRILAVGLLFGIVVAVLLSVFTAIANACDSMALRIIFTLIIIVCVAPVGVGLDAVIYKTLTTPEEEPATGETVVEEVVVEIVEEPATESTEEQAAE